MFYKVLKLNDLVENKEVKFEREVLLENGDSSLNVIYLKKDEMIDTHVSHANACAIVFDGEAEFHFDAEKFVLKKGESIMLKKDEEHRALALKDTKSLLVKT